MIARPPSIASVVASVATVAPPADVASVASVATAVAPGHVATVAPVATPAAPTARAGIPVATVATRQIAVATANPLMNKASCHTFHSGHSSGTDSGIGDLCYPWGEERRGRASILSLGSGKCGHCGHWPLFSMTYQWPHQTSMWPLWPLATIARPSTHLRHRGPLTLTPVAPSAPLRQRVRGPPPIGDPEPKRATTASSAKNQTVIALTTTTPFTETIMASTNLAFAAADASLPAIGMVAPVGAMLSLDLGTTTGWALRLASGAVESGTMSFRPTRYDGGGMRYLRFRSWLDGIAADAAGIAAVYFEEVRRHIGTDAAHLYGGFLATLTSWCEQHGIPYEGVPVGTIKRHVTGKGNADKSAVLAAVRARGFAPADDNEADAIAILLWAIETKGGVR